MCMKDTLWVLTMLPSPTARRFVRLLYNLFRMVVLTSDEALRFKNLYSYRKKKKKKTRCKIYLQRFCLLTYEYVWYNLLAMNTFYLKYIDIGGYTPKSCISILLNISEERKNDG